MTEEEVKIVCIVDCMLRPERDEEARIKEIERALLFMREIGPEVEKILERK